MLKELPSYLELLKNGELLRRAEEAYRHLECCDVCLRECKVDRLVGKRGICWTGAKARVSSYGPHFGEEKPLRGWRGSGTIFFNRCNLKCQYCQNHEISQSDLGEEVEPEQLARIMLELQVMGCHNINLVSPTHVTPQILVSLAIAADNGLHLPIVYNSGGYDSLKMLRLLDGVVDIYMPDMKYASATIANYYSKVTNYPSVNQAAVKEMYRQVGDLQIDQQGLASRGLLVRHLILPNRLAGTREIVEFLAKDISTNTYINLMDQYRPEYLAKQYPKINRRITAKEYHEGLEWAIAAGLHRLDQQNY